MDSRDAQVQLSAQRLRELMLWHGTDEGNLPPAATLENLSRDTIAALSQLQHARAQVTALRAALSQIFWSCGSSTLRSVVLAVLGAPPEGESVRLAAPALSWAASPQHTPLFDHRTECERDKVLSEGP